MLKTACSLDVFRLRVLLSFQEPGGQASLRIKNELRRTNKRHCRTASYTSVREYGDARFNCLHQRPAKLQVCAYESAHSSRQMRPTNNLRRTSCGCLHLFILASTDHHIAPLPLPYLPPTPTHSPTDPPPPSPPSSHTRFPALKHHPRHPLAPPSHPGHVHRG